MSARSEVSNYHNGRLDEMGFWKRVLTPAERAALYNCGQGVTHTFAPSACTPPPGQTWTSYYYAGSQRVAQRVITSTTTAGTLYYLHGDHLGSTSLVTCGSGCGSVGAVVARQRYHPFGTVRNVSGAMPTDYAFTGQRADDTGLMFYNARYYDGLLGRFVSADTIVPEPGNPQALNRYSYVLGNPLKYTDPSGHMEDDGCRGVAGGCSYGQMDYYWNALAVQSYCAQPGTPGCTEASDYIELAAFGASVVWDPADWALTARDCVQGQCSGWAILFAALPLLPSSFGKHVDDVFDALRPASLDLKAVRIWYLGMERTLKEYVTTSDLPLEQLARYAFDFRNNIRTWGRELMSDTDEAARLMREDPNLSWEEIIARAQAKGFSGDDIWRYIIDAATRSRDSVNKSLGLDP